ncbi:MAG: hypothetical protein CMJ90_06975 [Planctomycetes bacterium]|nr:hypothetical protein [Planctomycetota bacterium]
MRPSTLCVLILLCTSVPGQALELTINLSDGDPLTSDNPFGITYDPDGTHAYVSLCGDLPPWPLPPTPWAPAWNNDKVVKLNLTTGAQVAMGTAGHFPEDIALTLDASGQTRHVYVNNSSSGTVTCLSPTLNPIATISLTPCAGGTYGSVFPFGIAASPDGARIYAGGTSCATVDVIDSDPQSPAFNQVLQSFSVPNLFGRPAWLDTTHIVFPVTSYNFNPSLGYSDGSTTGLSVVDVTNPASVTTWMVTPFQQFNYPQITDIAVTPTGTVVAAIGYGLTPRVVEVDAGSGALLRTLDLGPAVGVGLHGVALSPDGSTLAVTALNGGELALIDIAAFATISVTPTGLPGSVTLPNEVMFSPDGSRLGVTLQGAAAVQIYSGLPSHALGLWADPVVTLGTTGALGVHHVQAGHAAWTYVSDSPGPSIYGPWTIQIGVPFSLLATLSAAIDGTAQTSIQIPVIPGLFGTTFHLQAITVDGNGSVRLSNHVTTTIN